jgi:hypothetical protein
MKEIDIHRGVCKHLKARGAPGLLWWHTPNGGRRGKVEGAIFKSLGVLAGVADLILVCDGKMFALELKADDGRPTVSQMQFISDFNAAIAPNGGACIVHGLDRALRTLEIWKLIKET